MQWSLVAAFIPIVNILWCGASAQGCNYTGFLLNLGYSKECIHSSQSSLISCSNGEAPPHKECCPAQENIRTTLTEVKMEQENITNILTEVKTFLQEMKSERENSVSEMKAIRQEIKSGEENSSSVVKFLLLEMKSEIKIIRQEMKSTEENSSSVVNSLLQEMKSEIKAIRQDMKSEIKDIRQEVKSERENSLSVAKSLLQEMKSEIKVIRQEMKSTEENSSSVVKSLLQEMQSEKNSSSVVKALLQEMKSERDISVSENKAIRQEIKSEGENSSSVVKTTAAPEGKELPKNCAELKEQGETSSGVQTVYPYGSLNPKQTTVYCDQVTDGGGWTVIQSRSPLPIRENFQRNWDEYVDGFGDPEGEFWIGLDNIHALTNSAKMQLKIDLEDAEGKKAFALYSSFHVGDAASEYVLRIGGYTGDAGDAMTDPSYDKIFNLNGMKFSTQDNDNDLFYGNCAEVFKGGWWFNNNLCSLAQLNGLPIVGEDPKQDGIHWYPFSKWDQLKKASMRIRPVSLGF